MIGTRIAHYEISAQLGEGGMAVVYRAKETELNRDVAIQVLAESLAGDEASREARGDGGDREWAQVLLSKALSMHWCTRFVLH